MDTEAYIRIFFFLAIFMIMLRCEKMIPRRQSSQTKFRHYLPNVSLVVIDSLIVRLIFPLSLSAYATIASENTLGLFNSSDLHPIIAIPMGIILLDFIIYCQHRLFHNVPILWNLHRVHHSDKELDSSTALRFHPLEILISFCIKLAVIAIWGISPISVLIFEVVLNGMALFNHANINLGQWDKKLRPFIVTPEMHAIHHSSTATDTHSNFGFNISLWDRALSTYRPSTVLADDENTIGLNEYQKKPLTLKQLLLLPFSANTQR